MYNLKKFYFFFKNYLVSADLLNFTKFNKLKKNNMINNNNFNSFSKVHRSSLLKKFKLYCLFDFVIYKFIKFFKNINKKKRSKIKKKALILLNNNIHIINIFEILFLSLKIKIAYNNKLNIIFDTKMYFRFNLRILKSFIHKFLLTSAIISNINYFFIYKLSYNCIQTLKKICFKKFIIILNQHSGKLSFEKSNNIFVFYIFSSVLILIFFNYYLFYNKFILDMKSQLFSSFFFIDKNIIFSIPQSNYIINTDINNIIYILILNFTNSILFSLKKWIFLLKKTEYMRNNIILILTFSKLSNKLNKNVVYNLFNLKVFELLKKRFIDNNHYTRLLFDFIVEIIIKSKNYKIINQKISTINICFRLFFIFHEKLIKINEIKFRYFGFIKWLLNFKYNNTEVLTIYFILRLIKFKKYIKDNKFSLFTIKFVLSKINSDDNSFGLLYLKIILKYFNKIRHNISYYLRLKISTEINIFFHKYNSVLLLEFPSFFTKFYNKELIKSFHLIIKYSNFNIINVKNCLNLLSLNLKYIGPIFIINLFFKNIHGKKIKPKLIGIILSSILSNKKDITLFSLIVIKFNYFCYSEKKKILKVFFFIIHLSSDNFYIKFSKMIIIFIKMIFKYKTLINTENYFLLFNLILEKNIKILKKINCINYYYLISNLININKSNIKHIILFIKLLFHLIDLENTKILYIFKITISKKVKLRKVFLNLLFAISKINYLFFQNLKKNLINYL
ncbi:hypothetical protein [Guillardia theta]|uniref:Uncharacterized protein n=1 Tax=Guillardia theta TaxID=55529 RepID=Q9AW75_GUITH|nr:hypothetical protein GTHECHR2138 [Guillardia theta]CAC26995.1 hypothetical protein [Guillardia theta]